MHTLVNLSLNCSISEQQDIATSHVFYIYIYIVNAYQPELLSDITTGTLCVQFSNFAIYSVINATISMNKKTKEIDGSLSPHREIIRHDKLNQKRRLSVQLMCLNVIIYSCSF